MNQLSAIELNDIERRIIEVEKTQKRRRLIKLSAIEARELFDAAAAMPEIMDELEGLRGEREDLLEEICNLESEDRSDEDEGPPIRLPVLQRKLKPANKKPKR